MACEDEEGDTSGPMPPTDVETLRAGYEAINRGDYEAAFQMMDPVIEWQPDDRTPFAGTYHGREGGRELLATFLEALDHFRWEPEDFFSTDDQVVVFVRQIARGKGSGAEVASRVAHLWTMREGRPVRWQGFAERKKALEAAGLKSD
jgi:ketosteroid isomerase-like protein